MNINEENYVDVAEKVILELKNKKDSRGKTVHYKLTTSQIRNLLAMTADILNDVNRQNGDLLSDDIVSRIEYLKVRLIYECGRKEWVKYLVEESDLLNLIKSVGKSKNRYILLSRYMEALVAFHKFFGGKEYE